MSRGPLFRAAALVSVFLSTTLSVAQQPTGTIGGIVRDQSGAVVRAAEVTVASAELGVTVQVRTGDAGTFSVGGLHPGDYELRVQAPNLRTVIQRIKVEVGRTTTLNVVLQVGVVAESVVVEAQAVRVNPAQTSLDGVVTAELIRELPLNGRNFLELGEVQPGAQVTGSGALRGVTGFNSALGVAGQSGMTTRVTLDGLDITDDHFGAAAANISQEAIQEFQVSRSGADISTGLTGNGAVNIATKSGGNELHGAAFLYWRDDALAARIAPEQVPFNRRHYGFSAGGPLRRDRLFWFASYERVLQNTGVATVVPAFPQFSGTWRVPYQERMALGRADWNAAPGVRLFARFVHNSKRGIPADNTLGENNLVPRSFVDFSNGVAGGADLLKDRFTHSFRFGYFNVNTRGVAGNALIPNFPTITDAAGREFVVNIGTVVTAGTNQNTPQHRFQDTYETRYDGGLSFGRHTLRWGGLVNVIRTNWYETLRRAPQITLDFTADLQNRCGTDVFCYPIRGGNIGNGLGWLSELPSLGFPYGGFRNTRLHMYVGESWRMTPRLNLSAGLRWVYEPGQNTPGVLKPAKLEQIEPGLSRPDRPDKNNFAPQVGLAWDPTGGGKWVVRANAGLYYETYLLRNAWWVRNNLSRAPIVVSSTNFANGLFDPNTGNVIFDLDGSALDAAITPGVDWLSNPNCNDPRLPPGECALGTPGLLDAIMQATAAYHAAYRIFSLSGQEQLSTCERATQGCQVMDPNYATPFTLQFSAGVQRELRPGLVLSVDYVRHRGQHYVLRTDANRLGAADTLNVNRAMAAMIATHKAFGCPAQASAAAVDCAISKGATISAYGTRGLGGAGTGASTRAFTGIDPSFNRMIVYRMRGWSTYNALQAHLRGRLPDVRQYLKNWTLVTSYSLGRLVGTSQEQNMVWLLEDDFKYMAGPTTLDRTHIFSLATGFNTVGGLRLNSFWRASSSLPLSVFVPGTGAAGAEIFLTDLDGDGSAADPLPGTSRGSYGRDIGCGGKALNRLIDAYNSTQAGQLTPAGQALVNAGLFSSSQLKSLRAVSPTVARAPDDQVCMDSLMTADVRISRPFKLRYERITLEPALEVFNVFNIANFDLPSSTLSPVLNGLPGSPNGTTPANRTNRAGVTGGTMSTGAPRSWQLSVRLTF